MPYPIETIAKIAARHGLAGELRRLPDTGMCNDAWQIGETHVLRVPHKAEWERESFVEALAVPAARLAGVCTPALVALGDERDLTPLAYTLYERALGVPLGTLDLQPMDCPGLWAELARQMLLMHRGVLDIPGADGVIGNPFVHPARENLKKARAQKLLEPGEIEEIAAWIDALEASPGAPPGKVFLHRDLHPWNLLVDPGTCTLEAIIDWGDAAFGDLALEFSSLPLGVIPLTLAEYRSDGG
ncbi:MAG: aminoglycoside phosphotransferase family protein, partial [Fimbriimonas ginsengisoli]|nr:aminoglycoside phosphotransferase family protein [Fimbriimonas ginsengisoli]